MPSSVVSEHSEEQPMELELNLRNLPALPELPIELQQMPFLHKSYLLAQQGSNPNSLECEIKSNKRMEIVGDGKLYGWIADMLVERYPDIGPGSVTHARRSLINNLLFSRIALAYNLDKSLRVAFKLERNESHKIYADTFEAYIGTLHTAIKHGQLPASVLENYLAKLFSKHVFPNIDEVVHGWQDHRVAVKRAHSARQSASKKSKKRARIEKETVTR